MWASARPVCASAELRIGRDRRLEILDAARQIFRRAAVPVVAAAQVVVVGADAAAAARQQRAFAAGELHAQGADDGARDLLLNGEHVLHVAVEGLRPEVHAGRRYRSAGRARAGWAPEMRTLPVSTVPTCNCSRMECTSCCRSRNWAAVFHATTRMPGTLVSAWINSSVSPSLKYWFSGLPPRSAKGSTATVMTPASRAPARSAASRAPHARSGAARSRPRRTR